jgi:hypothetical protein
MLMRYLAQVTRPLAYRPCARSVGVALCAAWLSLAPTPGVAQAPNETSETIRPLLVEAIRQGQAQGELGGEARDFLSRMFASSEPIRVRVERLEAVVPHGCYRLRVTTTQAGVYEFNVKTKVRATTPHDMSIAYKVNYCANGHFPEEGGGL